MHWDGEEAQQPPMQQEEGPGEVWPEQVFKSMPEELLAGAGAGGQEVEVFASGSEQKEEAGVGTRGGLPAAILAKVRLARSRIATCKEPLQCPVSGVVTSIC